MNNSEDYKELRNEIKKWKNKGIVVTGIIGIAVLLNIIYIITAGLSQSPCFLIDLDSLGWSGVTVIAIMFSFVAYTLWIILKILESMDY